jgi:hypothetical protein
VTPPDKLNTRQLRREILMARIALQRVELHRDIVGLQQHLKLPALISGAFKKGGAKSWLGTAFTLARRFPITGSLVTLALRRLPRVKTLIKWGGVAIALWPLIGFARRGIETVRARRRAERDAASQAQT